MIIMQYFLICVTFETSANHKCYKRLFWGFCISGVYMALRGTTACMLALNCCLGEVTEPLLDFARNARVLYEVDWCQNVLVHWVG